MGKNLAIRSLLAGCSLIGFTCYSASAVAQTAPAAASQEAAPPPSEAEPTTENAGDIIVTAQRRDQRLQDVPIAVSVVNDQTLKASNVTGLTDIQFLTPGVTFNTNFNASFLVRGVGTSSLLMTAEQSVGVVIDDVVQGIVETTFAGPSYASLNDIERIEVLKGPQGTLFGKNSSAGVIQIITKNPRIGEYGMDMSLSYASRDEINAQAAANIPLGSTAALRVAGSVQRRDGFIHNVYNGKDLYAYQRYGIRGKLLWEPTDALTVLLSGDYRQADDNANGAWTLRSCGSGLILFGSTVFSPCAQLASQYGIQAGPRNEEVALDGPTFTHQTSKVASLRLDYKLGSATLTSITAFRDLDQDVAVDTDATPSYVYSINRNPSGGKQFTQELRATGDMGVLNYTLGAFYYNARPYQKAINISTLGILPPGTPFGFSQSSIGPSAPAGYLPTVHAKTESWALFGQIEAELTDHITLIGGLRYTNDHVQQSIVYRDEPGVCGLVPFLVGGVCHLVGVPPTSFAKTKADRFTYKATAKYNFTPDINVYATYSTGYKGPMISYPSGQPQQLVRPETVKSYELGFKSTLFDRKVVFNVAAFKSDFDNFQAQQRVIDPLNSSNSYYTTTNAGSLETKGIEGDLTLRIAPEFQLIGNVAYVPTKFTDYAIQCKEGVTNPGTPAGQCTYVPPGSPAGTAPAFNARGYPLVYSPKWTFGVSGNFNKPLGNGESVTASATYNWRSDTYGEVANPNTINKSYGILNGQIGYGAEDGTWRFSVFGRNLLDTYYVAGIFTTPFDSGAANTTPLSTVGYSNNPALDSSRTVGAKLEVSF